MRRRNDGWWAIGFLVAALSTTITRGEEPSNGGLKVVVHINFAESGAQGAGLRSLGSVLKADPQAQIEVVCHAAGIGLVEKTRSDHAAALTELIGKGVRVVACENTMRQKSIRKEDLLPGVETVPSGAMEVIRKQQKDGFAYFKP